MRHVATLISAYERRGFGIRTGLNPAHFAGDRSVAFTYLLVDGRIASTGGGLSPTECQLVETIASVWRPKRIFVIGNAFGWSTLLLSLTIPEARVVAIDALVEGDEARLGFDLTLSLISDLGLDATVIEAASPQDVDAIVDGNLGGIDLALIDGLHTNEQQLLDYAAVKPWMADESAMLFHDVLDWGMLESFERIRSDWSKGSALLHRTPSGMGLLHTPGLSAVFETVLKLFVEDDLSGFDPVPIVPWAGSGEAPSREPGLRRRIKRRIKRFARGRS